MTFSYTNPPIITCS